MADEWLNEFYPRSPTLSAATTPPLAVDWAAFPIAGEVELIRRLLNVVWQ